QYSLNSRNLLPWGLDLPSSLIKTLCTSLLSPPTRARLAQTLTCQGSQFPEHLHVFPPLNHIIPPLRSTAPKLVHQALVLRMQSYRLAQQVRCVISFPHYSFPH